jgi:copper homeostasis protein
MQNDIVLEVCVESVDLAIAAERGGAHRIELCSDLALEGTTPSAGLMATTRRHLKIPIYAMIRPRAGDYFYSDHEIEVMERDIRSAKESSMDGVVLGVLDQNQLVDVQRTRHLVKLAYPLPVTFHRAFELCPNWESALEAVIQTGAQRILTSGNKDRATDSLARLRHLVEAARDRIIIMPGGGVRAQNVQHILEETGASEIHSSLGIKQSGASRLTSDSKIQSSNSSEFERRAREIRDILENVSA